MEKYFQKYFEKNVKFKNLDLSIYHINEPNDVIDPKYKFLFNQIIENSTTSHYEQITLTTYFYKNTKIPTVQYRKLLKTNPELAKEITEKIEKKIIQVNDIDIPLQNHIYYIFDLQTGKIIAYIAYNFQDHEFVDGNIHQLIYITSLEIHPNYRGLGLCNFAMENFITSTSYTYYGLNNVGDIPACKCYFGSFSKNNYTAYNYENSIINKKEICKMMNTAEIKMYFVKNRIIGGKIVYHKYRKYKDKYINLKNSEKL